MSKSIAKENLFTKIKNLIIHIFQHWSVPPAGKALPYKEWAAYSVGGMGAIGASITLSYITLSQGSGLAAALALNVDYIFYVSLFTSIVTIVTSPLISWLVDNTNTKFGKFRPYLLILPIPMMAMVVFSILLPSMITDPIIFMIVYAISFNIVNFLFRIYGLATGSLLQVITPIQEERTNLISVGTFFTSLGPSIVTMVFPLICNFMYTSSGGINSSGGEIIIAGTNTLPGAQIIAPIMMAIFLALGLVAGLFTKERVVVSKKYVQKVKFKDGLSAISKNKYFWITNISGILATFKLVATGYLGWICTYSLMPFFMSAEVNNQALGNSIQTILIGLIGFSNVPGMLLAPWVIKKIGKKRLILYSNALQVVLTIPMIIWPTNAWTSIIVIFLLTLCNGLQVVSGPALTADIYDYQQFKTGRREEGFISQIGMMMTTTVGLATMYITPAVQKACGYIDDPTVLLNQGVLGNIIRTMCIIGIVSGILGTIPYLFYDLSEKKCKKIIEVLTVRKLVADGNITEEKGLDLEEQIMSDENFVLPIMESLNASNEGNSAEILETIQEAEELAEKLEAGSLESTINNTNAVGNLDTNETFDNIIEQEIINEDNSPSESPQDSDTTDKENNPQ